MTTPLMALLNNPTIRAALQQAWSDSRPGLTGGHEEGGFIVRESTGDLVMIRWPVGHQDAIIVPSHPGCRFAGGDIVATFHTHPNTGSDYLQEPGETDCRAIRDDPDLKGTAYQGELVLSQVWIYLISPDGRYDPIATTREVLSGL